MADVIELALHARARRILFLFLRRHGLDFFLERRHDESFSRLDNRKIDLVMKLAEDAERSRSRIQLDSARSMLRRILIRRLALQLVENVS